LLKQDSKAVSAVMLRFSERILLIPV
jgi:hypothetical protein